MLYSILDRDARAWWYCRQQREQGRARDARRQERQTIRRWVRDLRAVREHGGGLTYGRGGASLYQKNATTSGIGLGASTLREIAERARVPFVDTSTIPEEAIVRWALRGPMPSSETRRFAEPSERSPYPYSSLCSVEFREWARLAATEGATIYLP
jgi:hypothetical protein